MSDAVDLVAPGGDGGNRGCRRHYLVSTGRHHLRWHVGHLHGDAACDSDVNPRAGPRHACHQFEAAATQARDGFSERSAVVIVGRLGTVRLDWTIQAQRTGRQGLSDCDAGAVRRVFRSRHLARLAVDEERFADALVTFCIG